MHGRTSAARTPFLSHTHRILGDALVMWYIGHHDSTNNAQMDAHGGRVWHVMWGLERLGGDVREMDEFGTECRVILFLRLQEPAVATCMSHTDTY